MTSLVLAFSALLAVSGPAASADTSRVELAVSGMTCGSCAVTARIALSRIEGVYRAEVSYDSARVVVWYDSTRVTPDAIIDGLRQRTGYEARVVEITSAEPPDGGDDHEDG